ncbi:MAG TPA: tetratricopeptide repeat protein [Bryobacterales bacterium]|nr:tetratricopeptide repeat protein [Bryobacterales bacterium]
MKLAFLLVLACLVSPAQSQDPASDPASKNSHETTGPAAVPPETAPLNKAYQALREKKYVAAIEQFLIAVQAAPQKASIRKELGYAYLKAGETQSAREVFEQALTLDPGDLHVALELAFLCYESGQEARALELFDLVRRRGDAASQKTAAEALARADAALRAAIERWSAAVQQDPANQAARLELARDLAKHREPARAAAEYLAAWRLPPRREEILLDLARSRHEAGDVEGAAGAWLLASRSAETRVAERARARLPRRTPFANEYRCALELDPANTGLRRDLAFLWLSVNRKDEAVREFETVVRQNPNDMLAAAQLGFLYLERKQPMRATPLLEKVAAGPDPELARRARQALGKKETSKLQPRDAGPASRREEALPHKTLGEKSLALSYLKDAVRELELAHEIDPDDAEIAFKLGVAHNVLHEDHEALRWFREAMRSSDPAAAAEARRSYDNLAPQFRRVQTSLWTLPMFSIRYHDAFDYAQLKTEFRLGALPIRPYLSLRLVGDWKRHTAEPLPQFLSESSMIGAVGARTPVWNGFMLWAEAGEAASYLHHPPPGTPRLGPDYRGGVSWFRNMGASLGGESPGAFAELNVDSVFLSRFQDNVITYWQMRHGYRLPQWGFLRSQLFWNTNVTFDRRSDYYANFVEFGPGFRFRVPHVSPPVDLTISALRGVYLINLYNPRRPNYYDLRIGLWYSFAR